MERRSYKRAAALLLSVCLLFGAFSVSAVKPGNYTDIANHWAYEDMAWTLEKELFLGVTPQSFQPDGGMTRAMFAVVMKRTAEALSITGTEAGENPYVDVAADAWYTEGVLWATANGLTQGTSENTFSPDMVITREMAATVLHRFLTETMGMDLPAGDATFTDASQVSAWAIDAVNALSGEDVSLILGFEDDTFRPDVTVTRAETAALLHRLYAYANLHGRSGVDIAILPNNIKTKQDEELPGNSASVLTANMAKNEAEGMQFVLRFDADVKNVKCEVSPLVNASGEMLEKVEMFRQHYVTIRAGSTIYKDVSGKLADGLIPMYDGSDGALDNTKIDVDANLNQGYWVTVTSAENQSAGTYTGTVTVTYDGADPVYIPVSVEVWDFSIPTENSYTTAFALWYTPEYYYLHGNCTSADAVAINEMYYEFFLDYRITSTYIPYQDPVLNLENEDDYIETIRRYVEREEVNGYNIPLEWNGNTGAIYTPTNSEILIRLQEEGLLDKGYLYNIDEPIIPLNASGELDTSNIHYQKLSRYAMDVYRLMIDLYGAKPIDQWRQYPLPSIVTTACPELESFVKDWCPLWYQDSQTNKYDIRMMSEEEIRRRRAEGSTMWWYGCVTPSEPYPTYHIQDDLITARLVHWMQRDAGVTGEIYWATTLWGIWKGGDGQVHYDIDVWNNPYTIQSDVAGDGLLAYPGTVTDEYVGRNVPVPTIRLETIRDGFEDYEYLTMLEEKYAAVAARLGLTSVDSDDIMDTYYQAVYQSHEYTADADYDRSNPELMLRVREIMAQDIMRDDEDVIVAVSNTSDNGRTDKVISVYADENAKVVVNGKVLQGEAIDGCYVYSVEISLDGDTPAEQEIYVNGECYQRILTPSYQ